MDTGYKKTLKEIIQENIDIHDILMKEHKEISNFVDIDTKQNFGLVVLELQKWVDKKSKLSNEKKVLFLENAVKVLEVAFERYNFYVYEHHNSEMKANYWKMKYESVKSSERTLDVLLSSNVRLIEENESLKKQLGV